MNEHNLDLLAFGAHPDDVEISSGGLLLKLSKAGHRIGIVDLSEGEMGTRGDVQTRYQESAAASKILKLAARENLKLPDCGIDRSGTVLDRAADTSQLSKIVAAIRKFRPAVVLAQYPKCRHPDHIAAGELITKAVFYAGLKNYLVAGLTTKDNTAHHVAQLLYYQTRVNFIPSFVVDITQEFDQKVHAIQAYASQLGLDRKDGPKTLLSSELTLSSLQGRDSYTGSLIGVRYAEAYLCSNVLQIDDPINFFAKNSGQQPFFFKDIL